MANAPIALFVYARLEHTRRTVASLLRNHGAAESDLFVFSDAARTRDQQDAVDEVRQFLRTIRGFRSVRIVERPSNLGLARSIIDGVGQVLAVSDTVVVLEDDMVTSPHFLPYMNQALERFRSDDRVISVHGYVYPVRAALPEAFFLKGADCWGWGTWRRGWDLFNPDGRALLDELTRRKLLKAFDFDGAHPYADMLRDQIAGRNDSWAIRWYASAFLADRLTLYPGRSLVDNIGNDGTGVHCTPDDSFGTTLSGTPIDVQQAVVRDDAVARAAFVAFFRGLRPASAIGRGLHRARAVFRMLTA